MLTEVIYLSIIIYILWLFLKKPDDYPPGHWGIPMFGYIPFNGNSTERNILNLKDQYGKTALWRIGTKIIIFLFDFDQIKDILQREEFTERPDLIVLKFLAEGKNRGIIASKGQLWHNGRRFSIRVMRDMGMGKSSMTSAVHYEAENLVQTLKEMAGSRPVQLPTSFHVAVVNVVWQMVASKRYDFDDPDLRYFEDMIQELQENLIRYSAQDIFPWLKTVLPNILKRTFLKEKRANELREKLKTFIGDMIQEHKENLNTTAPKDYIDAYLLEMKAQKDDINSTMSYDDLIVCICDLFGAGSETTTTTLHWIIFYLANFPNVQDTVQKEIDRVMTNGCISSDDRKRMPYTEAVIHEVHRHASMTGLIARMANQDTIIDGYTIPKGAIISPVVVYCHHDPKWWDEPKIFRPNRFLDEDGKFHVPKKGFIPFGYGKRQCLGEPLAKMQLFIFTVTIFKSLRFGSPPGEKVDLKAITANPLSRIPNNKQKLEINIR